MKEFIAKASVTIHAPISQVWDALTDPEKIKQYFFGSTVISDFQVGSKIIWTGEWEGKHYEDKGEILEVEKEKILAMSFFSPMSGKEDVPENYQTLRYELSSDGENTTVTLLQDNNATEEDKEHSEKNWNMMLNSIKTMLEGK